MSHLLRRPSTIPFIVALVSGLLSIHVWVTYTHHMLPDSVLNTNLAQAVRLILPVIAICSMIIGILVRLLERPGFGTSKRGVRRVNQLTSQLR